MEGLRAAPYQLVALSKLLLNTEGGLLVADGVGVGKTISAGYIILWSIQRRHEHVLVISPPGLLEKWRLELRSKFGLVAHAIRSKEELATAQSEAREEGPARIYILPSSRLDLFEGIRCGTTIIDEIHNFRNRKTRSWRLARKAVAGTNWRVGLSATPINNSVADLASIYSLLFPQFNPLSIEAVTSDLWSSRSYALLAPFLTRFTKERLGIQFARRRVSDVTVSFPPRYADAVRRIVQELLGRAVGKDTFPLESVTYFREASSSPRAFEVSTGAKLGLADDPKRRDLERVIAAYPGRVMVFCQFTETVAYLAESLSGRRVFTMTGEVPVSDREALIRSFRDAEGGVLLLTQVGSEGLDFQFCDTMINYDLHWNPMILEQRAGRIDRVGQTKEEVNIVNFRVRGSIDERILAVVGKKLRRLAGSPLDVLHPAQDSKPLFDQVALDAEVRFAERAAASFELSANLGANDDVVVRAVSMEACSPRQLTKMTELSWIDDTAGGVDAWMGDILKARTELVARLRRYESLV